MNFSTLVKFVISNKNMQKKIEKVKGHPAIPKNRNENPKNGIFYFFAHRVHISFRAGKILLE